MANYRNGNSKRRKTDNLGENVSYLDSKSGQCSTSKRPRFQTPDETDRNQKQSKQAQDSSFISSALPLEISVLKFAENRARELDALSQAVDHVGGTKLSFQRLPKHMRRRAMSHNIRRIPQRLRMKAQDELEKREKRGVGKRPSRRHRRRPSNLMDEYQRRQRRNAWLETHIWHAKRFKMTTKWGYRLPLHPSDKSLRACYRASTHHCLLQDVSYECCVELCGYRQTIIEALNHVCSKETGLTFAAKTTASGQRWGKVILYNCDSYPLGALGPVTFLWRSDTAHGDEGDGSVKPGVGSKYSDRENSKLWMWCHPASFSAVWTQLSHACALASPPSLSNSVPEGRNENSEHTANSKVGQSAGISLNSGLVTPTEVSFGKLSLRSLKDQMVKFHLTGPASNLVLSEILKIANISSTSDNPQKNGSGDAQGTAPKRWWQQYYSTEESMSQFAAQDSTWQHVVRCQSPGEVPPRAVLALTVRDPRVLLPAVRTKVALHEAESTTEVMTWEQLTSVSAVSPIWDEAVRNEVTKTKLTEQEMNRRRSQLLVPGSALQLGDDESRIPVLLLQQPGIQSTSSRMATTTRAAVGMGWELVVPRGWGMAMWVAMVYRGARVGGLREAGSLSTRSGQLHYPRDFPDCVAGIEQQRQIRDEAVDRYVRRPLAKRVNHHRIGVPAPFFCSYSKLVNEWQIKVPQLLSTSGRDSIGEHTGKQEISTKSNKEKGLESDGDKICLPYVLRCRQLLRWLQESIQGTSSMGKNKGQSSVSRRLWALLNQPQRCALVSENLHSLVSVVTSCLLRGVPTERTMICLPSANDLELLGRNSDFGGPVESLHRRCQKLTSKMKKKGESKAKPMLKAAAVDIGGKSGTKDNKSTLNAKQLEEKQELLKEPDRIMNACDRPIIGFLTDGHFDLGQGHGSGIGFCSLVGLLCALEGQNANKPLIVLLRNPVSRQYRFAHLSVLL